MTRNHKLFTSYTICKGLELKNRTVMASLYIGYNGTTKEYRDFHIKRAKGGVGMLIVPQSTDAPLTSWQIPEFGSNFKQLIDEVHKAGAKIILQLYENIEDINKASKEYLDSIPANFATAALEIKRAGFDGIEIHGAHYTPFAALLSKKQNKRNDNYGLNNMNGFKLILDTVKTVRSVTVDFPLLYRLSADDFVENGVGIDTTVKLAKELEKHGIDCLDISAGTMDSPANNTLHPTKDRPEGCFSYLSKEIKDVVDIPVITVGKIFSGKTAKRIIDNNEADLVSMGRPLIADPDLVYKIETNKENEINKCVFCNKGCLTETLFKGMPIKCVINPEGFSEKI